MEHRNRPYVPSGRTVTYNESTAESKEFARNKQIKSYVQQLLIAQVKKYKKYSITSVDCSGSLKFTSGDLYYALKKVRIQIKGKVTLATRSYNYWNIHVTLSDRYNYDEFQKLTGIASLLNNNGRAAQLLGIIKPFWIFIHFQESYKLPK